MCKHAVGLLPWVLLAAGTAVCFSRNLIFMFFYFVAQVCMWGVRLICCTVTRDVFSCFVAQASMRCLFVFLFFAQVHMRRLFGLLRGHMGSLFVCFVAQRHMGGLLWVVVLAHGAFVCVAEQT